jgi:hypothetical protein
MPPEAAPAHGPIRDNELRAVVRPLLRSVIRRPGSIYQPVFIGPVRDGSALASEIQTLAEMEGTPALFGDAGIEAVRRGTSSVVLLSMEESRALGGEWGPSFGAAQVIVWSRESASGNSLVQARLARGVAIDPSHHLKAPAREWSMAPMIARAAREPGRFHNPIFLIGIPELLPFLADEASLRLEAGGLSPVVSYGAPIAAEDVARHRTDTRAALVLRLATAPEGEVARELASAVGMALAMKIQVVVVLSDATREAILHDPNWHPHLGRAGTLVAAADPAPANQARSPRIPNGPEYWPALDELLGGAPERGGEPTRVLSGRLSGEMHTNLEDVVQAPPTASAHVRLVVFDTERLGLIDFEAGHIVRAEVYGDMREPDELCRLRAIAPDSVHGINLTRRLVEERVSHIAEWDGVQFAFVQMPEQPRGIPRLRMPPVSAALEIARRRDEGPRRALKTGGPGRVWKPAPGAMPVAFLGVVERDLWARMDGESPLGLAAEAAGCLEEEALLIVERWLDAGLLVACGEVEPLPRTVSAAVVARALLSFGLASDASWVLARASGQQPDHPEIQFLHAHLLAETDPQAAAAAFRRALSALYGMEERKTDPQRQMMFDALWNVLLLEVRGRQIQAPEAWEALQRYLTPEWARFLSTPGHEAVVAEIALRAGDLEGARTARDRIPASRDGLRDPLARALAAVRGAGR